MRGVSRRITLIPSPEASPAEKVLSRIKRLPRPDGMLQCPRCGSRSVLQIRSGVVIKGGKRAFRGTAIVTDGCAQCWKRGDDIRMVPGGQGPKLVK